MHRVLITGLGGFVGRHLGVLLAKAGDGEVFGSVVKADLGRELPLPEDHVLACDLLDAGAVTRLIDTVRPGRIYHIAGVAEVGRSWEDPGPAYRVNVLGQLNLLQAVVAICPDSRVLVVGSAGEYGLVRQSDCPIGEDHPLAPADPYGVSKAAQDLMAQQYFLGYGTDIVRTRSFNHIGPGQSTGFLVGRVARMVAEVEKGLREPVADFGDLSARRDFTDVRDVVRAYQLLMERGAAGEAYNVCSGTAVPVAEVVRMALALGKVPIEFRINADRERPTDLPLLLGDNSKLRSVTGWEPTIPLEKSVSDAVEFARGIV
jgi:GDP-4-dehydro-6-deoxy-D-mannose reductase